MFLSISLTALCPINSDVTICYDLLVLVCFGVVCVMLLMFFNGLLQNHYKTITNIAVVLLLL